MPGIEPRQGKHYLLYISLLLFLKVCFSFFRFWVIVNSVHGLFLPDYAQGSLLARLRGNI